MPREELYEKINLRVDRMIDQGLEQEARDLFEMRHLNALNTVGYKEFFEYFANKLPYRNVVELIKRNTRRYAKRQMTWWARDKDIRWFHPAQLSEILGYLDGIV